MEESKQWYVVYTRPGQEQKVCDSLRRKKIEGFYPVNKLVKTSYGRERVDFKPLLERYVFACAAKSQLNEIKSISGVSNFVHWLSQPVEIASEDIFLMKRFCNMHEDIHVEITKVVSKAAYISTRFSDHDTELVNFHFPVLGCNIIAEERRMHVKVITVTDYQSKPEISNNQYAETR